MAKVKKNEQVQEQQAQAAETAVEQTQPAEVAAEQPKTDFVPDVTCWPESTPAPDVPSVAVANITINAEDIRAEIDKGVAEVAETARAEIEASQKEAEDARKEAEALKAELAALKAGGPSESAGQAGLLSEAAATPAGYMQVRCKLPHGMDITMPDGRMVSIAGGNHPDAVMGFGKTLVREDDWEWIYETYKGQAMFKNGYIFAAKDAAGAFSQALDMEKVKTGQEGVDPKKPGGGVIPKSKDA